jgi:hypothetical protein
MRTAAVCSEGGGAKVDGGCMTMSTASGRG